MLTRRMVLSVAAASTVPTARAAPAIVVRGHLLVAGLLKMRCAIGHGGMRANKREGDGATPVGVYPLREVFYRPDRVPRPETALPVRAISAQDGWCDAPGDPQYNRLVALPYAASHEDLWRGDHLYDLLVVIGFNDAPTVSGAGSAIFLHVASPGWGATDGCVAVAYEALVRLLGACRPGSEIDIAA